MTVTSLALAAAARKVRLMALFRNPTTHREEFSTSDGLRPVRLGDIVVFDGTTPATVRSLATCAGRGTSLSQFIVVGELTMVVATVNSAAALSCMLPTRTLPPQFDTLSVGVTRYWAPHLPGIPDAMGELCYRVVADSVDGSLFVTFDHGPETIWFAHAGWVHPDRITIHPMSAVDADETVVVPRYGVDVTRRDPFSQDASSKLFDIFTATST